ncbi:MAG: hypothetical protein JSR77_12855 [Planctomycetes bacterium]|nr:hypothetical protein [Planctomycetota bacterium]
MSGGGESTQVAPAVAGDYACIGCGYTLRGLPVDRSCPECGMPVARSLVGNELRHAAPAYLRTLRTGAYWLLVGTILQFVTTGLAFVCVITIVNLAKSWANLVPWLFEAADIVPAFLLLWAYTKFTTPDPGMSLKEQPGAARRVARTALLVVACSTVARFTLTTMGIHAQFTPNMTPKMIALSSTALAVVLIQWIAMIVQFFAVLLYIRWLATRIPDSKAAASAKRYMWLLPVLYGPGIVVLFAGPVVGLVLYWRLIHRIYKHLTDITGTGLAAPAVPSLSVPTTNG